MTDLVTRRPDCDKCKLWEGCITPVMSGSGSSKPRVLFVGEAPGQHEDELGEPFIGKSGQLLRDVIDVLELDAADYRFTNTVRCRPPGNKTPTTNQAQYCSCFLVDEIEMYQPEVIVLLGNAPLKTVLGVSGITNYNGQVIERDECTYIPAFHPSYLLRNGSSEELLSQWMDALGKIPEILSGKQFKPADHYFQYYYPETLDDMEDMAAEIVEHAGITGYDVETVDKDVYNPDNVLLSAAFAIDGKAWSFPLYHNESHWTDAELGEVEDIMAHVLNHSDVKIVTHTKFDVKATRNLVDIDFKQYGDTIQLSRLLNAHFIEHGLKRLAGLFLRMFDYDKPLQDYIAEHPETDYSKGGSYAAVPLAVLLPYGGKDVAATVLLHKHQYEQLTPKQQKFYEQLAIPSDYMLGLMEDNGFKKDTELIARYEHIYKFVQKKFYDELLKDEDVQTYQAERAETNTKFLFNPNSSQQLAVVLYDKKKFPVYGETASGSPSCKRDFLLEMRYDFLEAGDDFTEEIDFLNTYLNWKLITTVRSKTFKPLLLDHGDWFSPDGRVRSDFVLGGAKTGRIASRNPNLQNIPSVESEPGTILQYRPAKNAFTHTFPGGGLLMADYSGMELRVIASVAGIQGMVDVFSRGGDVHKYVSSLIYKKPESEITKFERYRGKWCNWSLLYKGGWWTLYRLYRINGLTADEAKAITTLYYKAFPELTVYHTTTIEFLLANGYVESPFGLRLQLPEAFDNREKIANKAQRTAINMPIQGTAAYTLMAANVVIQHYMTEEHMRSMLVNTVHDSLVTDYYPGELKDVMDLQKDVMENIIYYANDFMPDIDFSWLKVPLKADFDIGTHYGSYGQITDWSCEKCKSTNVKYLGDQVIEKSHALKLVCEKCGQIQVRHYDADVMGDRMRYNSQTELVLPVYPEATERIARSAF